MTPREASQNSTTEKKKFPPQQQDRQPGREDALMPEPISIRANYIGADKLEGKIALISGGDSGIGRAVALHFAREGAKVAIIFREEYDDAAATVEAVEEEGESIISIVGDCGDKQFCKQAVQHVVNRFGRIDILVNNAGEQHPQQSVADIDEEQLRRTFQTNIFGYFFLTQAALPHMGEGAAIINTGSVTSFKGSAHLVDYSATKGAIEAFTRSLAQQLVEKKIRVNAVAPGPIWTPLIPASFSADEVQKFGENTLMKRAGQPAEVAPAYVFLASADSSYMTGQIIHINGGSYFG